MSVAGVAVSVEDAEVLTGTAERCNTSDAIQLPYKVQIIVNCEHFYQFCMMSCRVERGCSQLMVMLSATDKRAENSTLEACSEL